MVCLLAFVEHIIYDLIQQETSVLICQNFEKSWFENSGFEGKTVNLAHEFLVIFLMKSCHVYIRCEALDVVFLMHVFIEIIINALMIIFWKEKLQNFWLLTIWKTQVSSSIFVTNIDKFWCFKALGWSQWCVDNDFRLWFHQKWF